MTHAGTLTDRIRAEFRSWSAQQELEKTARATASQEREKRLERFNTICDELRDVWRPRIEAFAKEFGDAVKVEPTVTPSRREAKVRFVTDLADVTMTFSVSANEAVDALVLDYDLLIIPMLFTYDRHARVEMPLDRLDLDALARWIDDQLVSCVKSYLSIHDNEMYLKRAMVVDPVTKARFLRQDAAASIEHDGMTRYFQSEATMRQYKEKHLIPA